MPPTIDEFDDGAQGTIRDDALRARLDGFYVCGLLSVPSAEGTQSEGLTHPKHVVAIALLLLLLVRIELRLFELQPFLELSVEVECLACIELNTDAVQLAFEVDTMMVLQVVSIGSIASGGD